MIEGEYMSVITIERKILAKNDEIAQQNRELFQKNKVFVFNLVSSPGSGKTSILERTLEHIQNKINVAVIEGDVQTDFDAQRIAKYNVPVVQIVTRGGCHLDALLIQDALKKISLQNIRMLIIENVGNLVCPANYDLGEAMKVLIVSTTEGDDKPLKYPGMFLNATALIINKIDLIPYVNCNISHLKQNALQINPRLKIFETSCTTGAGIYEWCSWILSQIQK